jgi:hypothetical protein
MVTERKRKQVYFVNRTTCIKGKLTSITAVPDKNQLLIFFSDCTLPLKEI